MCVLCENIINKEDELYHWLSISSYEDSLPRNVIYKDIINHYLYSSVGDDYYNIDTKTLINYCPVCGKELK